MGSAVAVRTDYSAVELRRLAKASKDANQSRRLLSLAAVLDGMSRTEAARLGDMDRQTLRDWVHRFNAFGADGLKDRWANGATARLSQEQLAALATLVETGPDRAVHGVVRWRRVDLKKVVEERFGVVYHERTLPSRAPELNPVENVWQYLRANFLSNRVFDTYDDIIEAACNAWRRLSATPQVITSIGMRQWAHIEAPPP